MKHSLLRILGLLALAYWLFAATGSLQALDPLGELEKLKKAMGVFQELERFKQDTHVFRKILRDAGLRPISVQELADDPSDTLLIVFGDTNLPKAITEEKLRRFVEQGGNVLLATDRKTSPLVEKVFNISVSDEVVRTTAKEDAYKGEMDCPIVTIPEFDRFFLPIFKDIKQIATNKPGRLLVDRSWPTTYFPESCRKVKGKPLLIFATISSVGSGRFLALSDHSVFINSMLMQKDNDNGKFAQNCINDLTNHMEKNRVVGRRTRALFIDEGIVRDRFDDLSGCPFPVPQKPPSLPVDPVAMADQFLAGLEEENFFNRLLLERFTLGQILSALALGGSAALLGYGFYRSRQARQVLEAE